MSKISNVRFLPVDISEGKDYNRKEVVKLFPSIEAALASKRFNGATMDYANWVATQSRSP